VWQRTEKSQQSSGEKIEARKTVEGGDFCARLLFQGDFPLGNVLDLF
jgi:hypothetical protein